MAAPPVKPAAGMTLVELVVISAIVAILIGLAIPSWERHVLRAHRTEAISRMLRMASCQEITRADLGRYDSSFCRPAGQDHYRFAYLDIPLGTDGWLLSAEPVGRQARDRCGTLFLEHSGARRVSATGVESGPCWAGR